MHRTTHVEPIGRDNSITFVRLLIAMTVVFEHAVWFVPEVAAVGAPWIQGRMFFLIVTGLVLYPLANRITAWSGWWRFWLARWARLAPTLVVYLALVPVVIAVSGLADHVFDWQLIPFVAQGVVLLPRFEIPATDAIGGVTNHLWTIVVDVTFFILLPVLVAVARRFGFWRMLAGLAVVALTGSVSFWFLGQAGGEGAGVAAELLHHSFAYYGYIVAGMAAAALWHRLPLRPLMIVTAIAVTAGMLAFGPFVTGVWGPLKPMLVAAPLAYLVAAAGRLLPRSLERLAIRLGDISYPLFVLHPVVILVVAVALDGWGAVGAVFLVSLPLAWVVARCTAPFATWVRTRGEAAIGRLERDRGGDGPRDGRPSYDLVVRRSA